MPARRSTPRTPDARGERLQKILAAAGIASRRAAETMILDGRVSVNGRVVRTLGTRADAARDRILVDGRRVGRPSRARYYLVHKPRGVVTTTREPGSRRTVLDLVPSSRGRLFPVGRLDAASEGLVLLTNDGAAAQRLLHPSFEVPRTYRVSVDGAVRSHGLRTLADGIELDGRPTAPCGVRLLSSSEERSVVQIELIEGRRHQIRRMFESVGHPVRRLVRTRFGPLRLTGIAPGDARPATPAERETLGRMLRDAPRTQRPRSRGAKSAEPGRSTKTK